jgi:hypothetical protein
VALVAVTVTVTGLEVNQAERQAVAVAEQYITTVGAASAAAPIKAVVAEVEVVGDSQDIPAAQELLL